jgi:hypothetical protein
MPAFCYECGDDTTGKQFCDECGTAVQAEVPRGDAHNAQPKPGGPQAIMAINPVPEYSQADGNYIQAELGELGGPLGGASWMAPKIRVVPWKLIVGASAALLMLLIAAAVLLGSSSPRGDDAVRGDDQSPVLATTAATTLSPCLVADTAGGTSHRW